MRDGADQQNTVLREIYWKEDEHRHEVQAILMALGHSLSAVVTHPQQCRIRRWVDAQKTLIRRLELIDMRRKTSNAQMVSAYAAAQQIGAKPAYIRDDHDTAISYMKVHAIAGGSNNSGQNRANGGRRGRKRDGRGRGNGKILTAATTTTLQALSLFSKSIKNQKTTRYAFSLD
eukprot:PhM_4_TR10096/c1_g2_i1/m.19620